MQTKATRFSSHTFRSAKKNSMCSMSTSCGAVPIMEYFNDDTTVHRMRVLLASAQSPCRDRRGAHQIRLFKLSIHRFDGKKGPTLSRSTSDSGCIVTRAPRHSATMFRTPSSGD